MTLERGRPLGVAPASTQRRGKSGPYRTRFHFAPGNLTQTSCWAWLMPTTSPSFDPLGGKEDLHLVRAFNDEAMAGPIDVVPNAVDGDGVSVVQRFGVRPFIVANTFVGELPLGPDQRRGLPGLVSRRRARKLFRQHAALQRWPAFQNQVFVVRTSWVVLFSIVFLSVS